MPFLEVHDYKDIHGFGGHDLLEAVPRAVKKLLTSDWEKLTVPVNP